MNIFKYLNYKAILKEKIKDLKEVRRGRFTFEALARACRIQKTYLSKVLNHDGNLNSDQLFRACEFLQFNEDETDYIFLTYEFENTQVESRKNKIRQKISSYKNKYEVTESHIEVETQAVAPSVELTNYYADPNFILVHMFCTVDRFSRSPQLIAEFLGISQERNLEIINELCQMGVLKKTNGSVEVLKDNTHLSKLNVLYKVYRSQMRLKAIEKLNKNENSQYSFSVVFSSSKAVRADIQQRFMNFLKETQKSVQSNEEQEVYQMNFDLLSWSETQ